MKYKKYQSARTGFKILFLNLLHILVIAPSLAAVTVVGFVMFTLPAKHVSHSALWVQFSLFSFLLGWLARCCRLRAPFLPATLVAAWILWRIGLFEDELSVWIYLPFCWAGFFVPYPVRNKGIWDTSMSWVSQCPFVVIPLSLAFIIGSLWCFDGINIGFGTGHTDGWMISEARYLYQSAFMEMVESNKNHLRIDDADFRAFSNRSGGVYVRKGEIHVREESPDALLLVFGESRKIQKGGSLFPRTLGPMHTGLTVSGGLIRLSVDDFNKLNLSDYTFIPFSF